MSRVGKRPIDIPEKVEVAQKGQRISVKGPKGNLSHEVHGSIKLDIKDGVIQVRPLAMGKKAEAIQGLTRTLIDNMMTGVTKGFERALEVNGVGYRVELKANVLTFTLGYSHPVVYRLPEGVTASVDKNRIVLAGVDKEQVGSVAATIRGFRKPEPYKGKGIKFAEERIRRKVGKSGGKE
jgi:large subunit ribosomal protein L6